MATKVVAGGEVFFVTESYEAIQAFMAGGTGAAWIKEGDALVLASGAATQYAELELVGGGKTTIAADAIKTIATADDVSTSKTKLGFVK